MSILWRPAIGLAAIAACIPTAAWAQDDADALMALDEGALQGELTSRYDRGLAKSIDPSVVSADTNTYMWANEAKTQCAIALGFLKSDYRDPVSISKCVLAARLMDAPPPAAPARPLPPKPEVCDRELAGTIFFDFDSDIVPAGANDTVAFVNDRMGVCGWSSLTVVGHTDRSGTNAYNDGLSARRADAVADFLVGMGVERGAISTNARGEEEPRVPTEDGVRNPQNRRVEITAN